jgi:flagellar M-ring protein FliF
MEFWKRAVESVRKFWAGLNTSQRVVLSATTAVLVLALAWGSASTAKESMVRVAGSELRVEERDAVVKKLVEKNVRYELRNLEVYVARDNAEQVMLELAGEGVLSDQAIWKFLDEDSLVVGKWQLEKRYQRALEQKLGLMIRRVKGVRNASVQITPASESQQLGFQGPKAGASVQLELQQAGALPRATVIGIAGLVARAVPGLDPDRVHLMDTAGTSYRVPRLDGAAASGEIRDVEARLEEEIKAKIAELFPSARTVVRAIARQSEERQRSKTHQKGVVLREEETNEVVKNAAGGNVAGIKGEGELNPDPAGRASNDEKKTQTSTQYAVDVKELDRFDPMGAIESITVGVLIPYEDGGKPPMELVQAKELIAKAVGKQADEKSVAVQFVPTTRPAPIPATPFAALALEWLSLRWTTLVLVVLALLGLFVLFRIVRGAAGRTTVEDLQALQASLAEPSGEALPAAEGDLGRLRAGVREAVSRNPQSAASALKQLMAPK